MHAHSRVFLGTAILVVATCQAMAGPAQSPASPPTSHVLPVLVRVDKSGQVTDMTPANHVESGLMALLRKTVAKLITQPAHDTGGNAIASQLIMDFSVQTHPLPNGSYTATISYVSAQPVGAGHWHWVHLGQRTYLERQDAIIQNPMRMKVRCDSDNPPGAGHRKEYIVNGLAVGTEPEAAAGKC